MWHVQQSGACALGGALIPRPPGTGSNDPANGRPSWNGANVQGGGVQDSLHLLLHPRASKTRGLVDNGTTAIVQGGGGSGGGGGGDGLRIVCSQQHTGGDAEARHATVRASWHGTAGM